MAMATVRDGSRAAALVSPSLVRASMQELLKIGVVC